MATIKRLTARQVTSVTENKMHPDGGNLYLRVRGADARSWVFRYKRGGRNGKAVEIGLGSVHERSLVQARDLAGRMRTALADGGDPANVLKAATQVPTFGTVADEMIAALKPQFRNAKHIAQWTATLKGHAAPLRSMPVDTIDTDAVLAILKPIWTKLPETASRVRGRVERVLDAAKAKGHRKGENPALWRGHLAHLLPKRQKLTRGHHPAMPYADVPAFVGRLRERDAMTALALELCILTAVRSGEIVGATVDELDLEAKIWTIPATRMKAARPHRVPLTPRAVEILEKAAQGRKGNYVFPGNGKDNPLSSNALRALLIRMKAGDVTVHGFRSSFRDWAGDVSTFPRELAEEALAHNVGNETERSYRREDAIDKRRKLMEAWANYCEPQTQTNTQDQNDLS